MTSATFPEVQDAMAELLGADAVFAPQATDLLFLGNHGDLAQRLADARELKRQGVDTSGTEAAILTAWESRR